MYICVYVSADPLRSRVRDQQPVFQSPKPVFQSPNTNVPYGQYQLPLLIPD